MPWKTMEVSEQRIQFVKAAAQRAQPFSTLCEEYGISRPTGYLWWKRFEQDGVRGLREQPRKPLHSPRRTAEDLEQLVVEQREQRPDWGARKLQVVLAKDHHIDLPCNTIHRILRRHHLVPAQRRDSAALGRFERAEPNELWQMDFKGPKNWPQPRGPLSVLDDHSRYLIVLAANGSTRSEPVREQLEGAFDRCGMPEAMLMDHGTPWEHQRHRRNDLPLFVAHAPGPSFDWSGVGHPQTQGKVERFHRALQSALRKRGVPAKENVQAWLDAYREEHNQVRPHQALGMQTPATRWRPSARRYDPNPPRWEYPEGAWVRKLDGEGKLGLQGHNWNISRSLAGEQVQIVPVEHRLLVFYCQTLIRELDLKTQRSTIVEGRSREDDASPTL